MGTDLLRVESNERVDLADFEHAVDASQQANHRQWAAQMFSSPSKGRQFILDGFEIDNPSGDQVRVTLGRAILGQREDGQVFQGHLVSEGNASRTIDVNGFANATYGIYVRFEYLDGSSQGRAFWDPQGDGSEFSQSIPTRKLANWSLRIEISSPGSEWLQIGQVIVSAGSISTGAGGLVDLRTFYFEGQRNADIAPATPADNGTQFESGWSTDGGGGAQDRNDDRELYGVKDLQTFTSAMRQCLEDIKGRGLKRWWERDIGGMNIGFDANPVSGRFAIGDANFYTEISGSDPTMVFASSGTPTFVYDRTAEQWELSAFGFTELSIGTNGGTRGVAIDSGLTVGVGLSVGHSIATGADTLTIGSTNFAVTASGGIPQIRFSVADNKNLVFNNPASSLAWEVGGSPYVTLSTSGISIDIGELSINSSDFHLYVLAPNRYLQFDANNLISLNTSTNEMTFRVNSATRMFLDASGAQIPQGLNVGIAVGTSPTDNQVTIGDTNFGSNYGAGTAPYVFFDGVNDRLEYNRSANRFSFLIGAGTLFSIESSKITAEQEIDLTNTEIKTPTTTQRRSVHRANILGAYAGIDTAGGVDNGYNIASVTNRTDGYDITYDVAIEGSLITPVVATARTTSAVVAVVNAETPSTVDIRTYNSGGSTVDNVPVMFITANGMSTSGT